MRQLATLQAVPRSGAKIGTRQLCDRLAQQGYELTQRTVQRDLKGFSELFPGLKSDGNPDQAGWFWQRDSTLLDLPGLDIPMAMTFILAQRYLSRLMPPAVLNQLQSYFDSSVTILNRLDRPSYAKWVDRVRILPRSQPLLPAEVEDDVVVVVYQALLEGRQFRGRYQRRDGDEAEYEFHPLGLVIRESVIYMVATVWDYQDPRHYALHRFRHATLLDALATQQDDFDFDTYLMTGAFEYVGPSKVDIRLMARFSARVATHLSETPLSEDQMITSDGEGFFRIEATVKCSNQLRWWILGFGDQVEVLEPQSLRDEIAETLRNASDYYA
jgi:predicted DNA-binding transcriptional regulator YafY